MTQTTSFKQQKNQGSDTTATTVITIQDDKGPSPLVLCSDFPQKAPFGQSQQINTNENKQVQVLRSGIDARAAPFGGVIAPDALTKNGGEDDPEDLLPPVEQTFWHIPASRIQLSLAQQMYRIPFFFLFCITVQCFILNFTTMRYPDPATQQELPDLAFALTPRIPEWEQGTAFFLLLMNIMAGITIICLYLISNKKIAPRVSPHLRGLTPRRLLFTIAWLRWWGTFAAASCVRSVTIIMTTLPSTNNHCKTRPQIPNIWENTLKGVLSLGASNIHCGDLLISGHTVAIMTTFMTCWTYGPLISRAIRPLVFLFTGAAMTCMVVSRSHYSDDIIVAVIVVMSAFWLFGHNPRQGAPYWQQAFMNPLCFRFMFGSPVGESATIASPQKSESPVQDQNQQQKSSPGSDSSLISSKEISHLTVVAQHHKRENSANVDSEDDVHIPHLAHRQEKINKGLAERCLTSNMDSNSFSNSSGDCLLPSPGSGSVDTTKFPAQPPATVTNQNHNHQHHHQYEKSNSSSRYHSELNSRTVSPPDMV